MIWGPFEATTPRQNTSKDDSAEGLDHEANNVTIGLQYSNFFSPMDASPGFISGIPDNEEEDTPEDTPSIQNSPAKATPDQHTAGDPNLRPERLRHSTRNEKKDYYSLHHKGFAKVARAAALMDGFDEPSNYKEAINSSERDQ